MVKLGFTLLNLGHICLHSSTSAKFCPFTEGDYDLFLKISEDLVGGPSTVKTHKAVVDKTHIHLSTKGCNK